MLSTSACAGLAWLPIRWPTVLLLVVLATFALGLQWIFAGHVSTEVLAWVMPAQMLLFLAAVLASIARYGVRLDMTNWPLLAVLWLLLQSLLLADLDPAITAPALLGAALSFALPWCLVHVALQPGSRVHYALLIALLPALCVVTGAALELFEAYPLFAGSNGRGVRLQGASNAGWLAFLAFTGFAAAGHEAVRRRRVDFACLATLNVVIAILSGGRMGLIACGIVATTYLLLAPALRARAPLLGLLAAVGTGGLLAVALQVPIYELAQHPARLLDPNGRDQIWRSYLREFLSSPLFGRGLGAAEHGAYHRLPHNEYLRLLVDGGLVGAALYGTAVLVWAWRVLDLTRPAERPFVWALFLALGAYAFTDNVLIMPPGVLPVFYLAVMRMPSRSRAGRRSRRRPPRTKSSAQAASVP